ncbi:MAG: rhomboid family intramembrane serine protease [Verrucomicrobiota bacterium]
MLVILWANIAVFLLQHVFDVWVTVSVDAKTGVAVKSLDGAVSWAGLKAGKVYLLITSMFVHAGILHILGNMLIVYFFGKRLLEFFGPKNFLGVYFAGGICGALLQLAASPGTSLIGASGGAFALVCAFATILPQMEIVAALYFVVPIRLKMKYLGFGLAIGSLVLALLKNTLGIFAEYGHLAHFGGCVLGWYYARVLGFGGRPLPFFGLNRPRGARVPGSGPAVPGRFSRRPARFRTAKVQDAAPGERPAGGLKEEMARVLDKINREGFQSLTEEEKRTLERGSELIGRRTRGK